MSTREDMTDDRYEQARDVKLDDLALHMRTVSIDLQTIHRKHSTELMHAAAIVAEWAQEIRNTEPRLEPGPELPAA